MKVIKFLRSNAPYNAGEIAGFSKEEAARYVKAGIAEYVKKEKAISSPKDKMMRRSPRTKKK